MSKMGEHVKGFCFPNELKNEARLCCIYVFQYAFFLIIQVFARWWSIRGWWMWCDGLLLFPVETAKHWLITACFFIIISAPLPTDAVEWIYTRRCSIVKIWNGWNNRWRKSVTKAVDDVRTPPQMLHSNFESVHQPPPQLPLCSIWLMGCL